MTTTTLPNFRVLHIDSLRDAELLCESDDAIRLDRYTEVATVRADDGNDDPDEAYCATQNLSQSWLLHPRVQPSQAVIKAGGARSTSVGDIVIVGREHEARYMLVASVGFEDVTDRVIRERGGWSRAGL